jgi:AraC family transcriptional regulator, ethanolamine operon transcriptional activator
VQGQSCRSRRTDPAMAFVRFRRVDFAVPGRVPLEPPNAHGTTPEGLTVDGEDTRRYLSSVIRFAPRERVFSELTTLAPWVRAEQFCDIDSQAARYQGYGQQYQQLSRGAFQGRVVSFDFGGDLVVHVEKANQDIAVAATTPASRLGLCVLTEISPLCTFNGASLTANHVLVCPRGNGFVGKTAAGFSMYCMDLSQELLLEEIEEWTSVAVIHEPRGAQNLREVVESGLATFAQRQSIEKYSAAVRAFKSSVAEALWRIISRTPAGAAQRAPQSAQSRTLRQLRAAQEYIDHSLTRGISVVEICRQTGTSRRALERMFLSILGMGPAAYIRNLQLNRVRHDLVSGQNAGESIGDIAARYGVWHWSRFSQNYQLFFGELPSQTRARHVAESAAPGQTARVRGTR